MAYNQYGDLIAQTSEDDNREDGLLELAPAKTSRSELRFLYEYDAPGNWTSTFTEVRHNKNQDFSVTSTEPRTLTYFDPI